ncbi:MAG: SDR family NAD(P)-dependent oxidoreductase [Hyphomicrobiaceae bacterium]
MSSLQGRVAVVTGSAMNIGRATALMLAREGASVMVHAKSNADGVAETRRLLDAAGVANDGHLADCSTEDGARGLIEATVARFGRIDILVNNAAIRRNTPITELSYAEWREVLANSLDCAFLTTRYAAAHMIASKWGRIVNLGGISMFVGTAGRAHVSAAKAGMIGMSRALATELGPHGITVNVVAPGIVDTVRGGAAGARPGNSTTDRIPVRREGRPEEIAHVITMLCRPEGAYTTGQTIEVNGGSHFL